MGQKERSEGFDSEDWKGLDLLLLSSKGGHELEAETKPPLLDSKEMGAVLQLLGTEFCQYPK